MASPSEKQMLVCQRDIYIAIGIVLGIAIGIAIGIVWKSVALRPDMPLGPSLTTGKNPIMLRMFGEQTFKFTKIVNNMKINKRSVNRKQTSNRTIAIL